MEEGHIAGSGKYDIQLDEVQGAVIGDRNTVKQTFISTVSTFQEIRHRPLIASSPYVEGALQKQADKIYHTFLAADEQLEVQTIFVSLVDIKEAGKFVSRPSEQAPFRNGGAKEKALDKLIENRLLVGDKESPMVEVAHEALLTNWPLLKEWIKDKENEIVLINRLKDDARIWAEKQAKGDKSANDELWSGSKLERVRELQGQPLFDGLGEEAEQFITAGVEAKDRQLKKLRRDRRIFLAISAVLSVVSLVAVYQLRRAELGRMQQYEATSKALLDTDPVGSLVNATAAVGLGRSPLLRFPNLARTELVSDVLLLEPTNATSANQVLRGHEGGVGSVAVSGDGQTIVSRGEDGSVRLWDAEGHAIGAPLRGHEGEVYSVAVSGDGQTIVSGGEDGSVRLWDNLTWPGWLPFACERNPVVTAYTEVEREALRICKRYASP
jgi:hypothetical protein